jgi:hypothetical protein
MAPREHSHATEGLIVVSQTVFFVFLFIFLKKTLIDNRGMMANKRKMDENSLQLGAIFFAIVVFLGLMMIPLIHYEYAEVVLVLVAVAVGGIIIYDVRRVMRIPGRVIRSGDEEEGSPSPIQTEARPPEEVNAPPPTPPAPPEPSLFQQMRKVLVEKSSPSPSKKYVQRPANDLEF